MEDYEIMGKNIPTIRTIKRRNHKIIKIISGRTLLFTNVPNELSSSKQLLFGSLLDNIREYDCADFIMITYEDQTTKIYKNRYGKRGTVRRKND